MSSSSSIPIPTSNVASSSSSSSLLSSSEETSLKLCFNGEIRRLSVNPKALTYDELVNTTLRIFPHLLSVQFSWVDDENDTVMIDSDAELSEALRVMLIEKKGYLRFKVTPKHKTDIINAIKIPTIDDFGTIVHEGYECDSCGMNPITGPRFKCTVRENFDLCQNCERKCELPYPTVKIYCPSQSPAAILTVVDEQKARNKGQRKHRGITCNLCKTRNFTGYRFKCSVRPDFDLCSNCEAQEAQPFAMIKFYRPNELKSIEVVPREGDAIGVATSFLRDSATFTGNISQQQTQSSTEKHFNIRCSSCGTKPIIGIRYKCSVRPYFNLCEICEAAHPQQPHPMIKMLTSDTPLLDANVLDHIQVGVSNSLSWLRGATRSSAPSEKGGVNEKNCRTENLEECTSGMNDSQTESVSDDISSSGSSWVSSRMSSSGGRGRSLEQLVSGLSSRKSKSKEKLKARFIKDVTMPDGSEVAPCASFYKTWRVRNDGSCDWPAGCHLVTAGGDCLLDPKLENESKKFISNIPVAASGEEVDITLKLLAPSATGRHVGYFRFEDPGGSLFGQRLWCDIRVAVMDMGMTTSDHNQWQFVEPEPEEEPSEPSLSVHDQSQMQSEKEIFEEGCIVRLKNLQDRSDLNGEVGTCKRWDDLACRWEVELHDGSMVVMIRPNCLEVCESYFDMMQGNNLDDDTHVKSDNIECDSAESSTFVQESNDDLLLWSTELNVLKEMGFHNSSVLLPLLKQHIPTPASMRNQGVTNNSSYEGLQSVVLSLLSNRE